MPKYRYKALTPDGRIVEGEGEFPSLLSLAEFLSRENLTLISTKELTEKEKKEITIEIPSPFGGVSDRDWSLLCRQLSVLIGAGVGIVEALQLLSEQITNKKLKKAILDVSRLVEEGSSFTAALRKHRDIFPEFIINLVEVGEETGELDLVLRRAADYYEKLAFIKGKVKSASFYPATVMFIATLIVGLILTYVVPKFQEIYESLGGSLPGPTQLLLEISLYLRQNVPIFFAFLIIFVLIFTFLYRYNSEFKKFVHTLILRIPKIGSLVYKAAIARFGRTMATLFSSGVPIERALEITSKVVGLIPISESINKTKKDVLEGKTLWLALEKTRKFPKIVIAMVKVGEETGQIDEMLNSIANFFEEEVDRDIEGLISIIEPVLIVILGVIIGAILIALYLPIFEIGKLIVK